MASDRDILPDSVKPKHYNLSIYDIELGGDFSYQGTVSIQVDVKTSTKEITLNTCQLKIHSVELKSGSNTHSTNNVSHEEKRQRSTFTFDEKLPTGDAVLTIKYQGTVNNLMCGFYRSRYKPAVEPAKSVPKVDEWHYMFSTQFESCDARRAFPCFDEPNLKATFDIDLEIPDDQTALSNMPVKETTKGKKDGYKVVSFDRIPTVSTYLVAWAIGDFEYIETFTERKYNGKNLPVRVYTTRGLKDQGALALDVCHKTVDFFSDIFRLEYPLPKVDLLAVHEFSHGAMENWGLITYRTTRVLYDEANSDPKYKNGVSYVVCHELAHQWFGNLVTMDWWNELWLNEGFATWVGWHAVDHLHPEWNVGAQFVSEGMQTAFQLDAMRSSHPIEVPVRDALEVDQIFDHISYLKGSSMIRMLSSYLGVDTFLLGVSNYLKKHQYSNATTNDLWQALSDASGQDIPTFMDIWIKKIGFPVITVAEEPGQISVQQSRFLLTGDVKPDEDTTTWWVPLGLKTGPQAAMKDLKALTTKEDTIRDVDDSFYKLNGDQAAFYRTNYPPARLTQFGSQRQLLSEDDKIGLISDSASLAISGHGHTTSFLALVEKFKDETNYLVWASITQALGNIRSIFGDVEDVSKGLRLFTRKLVADATDKIGFEFPAGEDYLTGNLRALLIAVAGLAGHAPVVDEAKRRFAEYSKGNKDAIPSSLRSALFRINIADQGKPVYEALKEEYKNTTSIDGKEICLLSLGRIQDPELAYDLMNFTFSSAVATQDQHTAPSSLGANPKVRSVVWKYIKENWDSTVHPKLSGNSVVLERFIRISLNKFSSFEFKEDFEKFFADKDNGGYDRALAVVSDTVLGNAKYKERDAAIVREWLGAHGYL